MIRGTPALLLMIACTGGSDEPTDGRLAALEADLADVAQEVASLAELESRIAELEATQESLAADVAALEAASASTTSALDALSDETSALSGRLDDAELALAAVDAAVQAADASVVALGTDVMTLDADVVALDADLTALSSDVATRTVAAQTFPLSNFVGVSVSSGIIEVASVTVDVPADGHLVAVLQGGAVFFGEGRAVNVGLGSTPSALDVSTRIGRLDGSGTDRFHESYAVTAQYAVSPGPFELHMLAQPVSTFSSSSVNVIAEGITVLFVPDAL